MKIIYKFGNGEIESRKVDDDYKPVANETVVQPSEDIRYPCDFDGENWVNIETPSEIEYEAPNDTSAQGEPSKEWQAINMLALQVAQLKAEKGGA